MRRLSFVLALVVLCSSCAVSSAGIDLHDLDFTISVDRSDDAVLVVAFVRDAAQEGLGWFEHDVVVGDGDELVAHAGADAHPLTAGSEPHELTATFDAPATGDDDLTVVVTFARAGAVEMTAQVEVPPAPRILAPADGARFSRADGLQVEASPPARADDELFVDVIGPCITSVASDGDATRADLRFDSNDDGACTASLEVSAARTGTVDGTTSVSATIEAFHPAPVRALRSTP